MNDNKNTLLGLTLFILFIFFWLLIAYFSTQVKAQGMSQYGDHTPTWSNGTKWKTWIVPNQEKTPGPTANVLPLEPLKVAYPNAEEPGTIIIVTSKRRLYLTLDSATAYEYPIAVGREGFTWTGTEKVSRIEKWPEWIPPVDMRIRRPELPERMKGGINNPLGAVAIYLGNSLYRIHGTNEPKSIGRAESSGCFRMLNEHAVHLASIVKIGSTVRVTK